MHGKHAVANDLSSVSRKEWDAFIMASTHDRSKENRSIGFMFEGIYCVNRQHTVPKLSMLCNAIRERFLRLNMRSPSAIERCTRLIPIEIPFRIWYYRRRRV